MNSKMKIILFGLALQTISVMATGGWSPSSVNDPQVVEMSEFSVPLIQGEIYNAYFFKLLKINSAESQVVAGMNYRMMMTLVETTVDDKNYVPGRIYPTAASPATVECTVVVYDKPWVHYREVTLKTCGAIKPAPARYIVPEFAP